MGNTTGENIHAEREFHNRRAEQEDSASDRLSFVYCSMADVMEIPANGLAGVEGSVLEVGCYLGGNSTKAGDAGKVRGG